MPMILSRLSLCVVWISPNERKVGLGARWSARSLCEFGFGDDARRGFGFEGQHDLSLSLSLTLSLLKHEREVCARQEMPRLVVRALRFHMIPNKTATLQRPARVGNSA